MSARTASLGSMRAKAAERRFRRSVTWCAAVTAAGLLGFAEFVFDLEPDKSLAAAEYAERTRLVPWALVAGLAGIALLIAIVFAAVIRRWWPAADDGHRYFPENPHARRGS